MIDVSWVVRLVSRVVIELVGLAVLDVNAVPSDAMAELSEVCKVETADVTAVLFERRAAGDRRHLGGVDRRRGTYWKRRLNGLVGGLERRPGDGSGRSVGHDCLSRLARRGSEIGEVLAVERQGPTSSSSSTARSRHLRSSDWSVAV